MSRDTHVPIVRNCEKYLKAMIFSGRYAPPNHENELWPDDNKTWISGRIQEAWNVVVRNSGCRIGTGSTRVDPNPTPAEARKVKWTQPVGDHR